MERLRADIRWLPDVSPLSRSDLSMSGAAMSVTDVTGSDPDRSKVDMLRLDSGRAFRAVAAAVNSRAAGTLLGSEGPVRNLGRMSVDPKAGK